MAIKLTFHTHKGGTGKTSLSILSAMHLVDLGYKVLCVDLDAQGSLTDILTVKWNKKIDEDKDVYWDAEQPMKLTGTATKDLFMQDFDLNNLSIMKSTHNIDLLYMRPNDFSANAEMFKKENIAKFLSRIDAISANYDFVFFDFPPTATLYVMTILTKLDYFVIPQTVAANILATAGEKSILKTLEQDSNLLGIVLNRVSRHSKEHQYAEKTLRARWGNDIFKSTIHNSVSIDTAMARNTPLNKLSGGMSAYNDIKNMIEELLKRMYVKQAQSLAKGEFKGTASDKQHLLDYIKTHKGA